MSISFYCIAYITETKGRSRKEQGQRVLKREEIIETLSTHSSLYELTVLEMKQSQIKQVRIRESLPAALLLMITLVVERGFVHNYFFM